MPGQRPLHVEPIPAFDDNYIWLLTDDAGKAAVVDPGDAKAVLAVLNRRNLKLDTILITHHHGDHTGGVTELKGAASCRVIGPDNPRISDVDVSVQNNDQVLVLGCSFTVLAVPGHTLDHIAYLGQGQLFCGDTLFAAGCGRVFEGTFPMMRQSLSKLRELPSDTRIFCAHEYTMANLRFASAADPGNPLLVQRTEACQEMRECGHPTLPSTLAVEMATNPFLRWDDPQVISCLRDRGILNEASPDAVFTALREWKDRF